VPIREKERCHVLRFFLEWEEKKKEGNHSSGRGEKKEKKGKKKKKKGLEVMAEGREETMFVISAGIKKRGPQERKKKRALSR